ncbi:hydrogenase formation protein HypD [Dyadobacter frigoris]|uniref:Hydrogenase formation protein HypD n=1 Tax=Dyadobacter frigoris TaxID=2576211 RepID=A0A4U6CTV9_9BACT|nr:hydrogenase formation protein HypD [Dyadobacter frigoris]TKT87001.1 hydrogenase formation protein HypD [Dyadobacter frigoris]GLU52803.1 hydrogenase formation protein HypD [Dyadobacter frigoris]
MKFLTEYRNPEMVAMYLDELRKTVTRPWTIMEVCGGQTHSLVKNGILNLLPPQIQMVHGPGCPVCVTPLQLIDKAVFLAEKKGVILCSFGDMIRVPGSERSLLEAKAAGADVRIMYSPLEAVKMAKENPDREVVFFAVGFETTAPANALSVIHAKLLGLKNYSILASHVLVPPAMEAIMNDEVTRIQAFLAAGHVCAIMGMGQYYDLVEKFDVPIVVTGFEPVDLLQGILMTVRQLETGKANLENQYARVVKPEGNPEALKIIKQVFKVTDREWRGLGIIPLSGWEVKEELALFDASKRFSINIARAPECPDCIAGQILKGIKKPAQCSQFGTRCTPEHPLGAPMVSSEGACAAYYHFANVG